MANKKRKSKKTKKGVIPDPEMPKGVIPDPVIPANELLSFSFKYLDCCHDKFAFHSKKAEYFFKVFERMKNLCGMKIMELKNTCGNSKALRCHSIKWSETSEPDGFTCLNDQLKQQEPYQFCITANEYGRVIGFIVDSVFFVVWLDPEHALYF